MDIISFCSFPGVLNRENGSAFLFGVKALVSRKKKPKSLFVKTFVSGVVSLMHSVNIDKLRDHSITSMAASGKVVNVILKVWY